MPECVIRALDKNLQLPVRDGQNDGRGGRHSQRPREGALFEAGDRGGCGTGIEKGIRKIG